MGDPKVTTKVVCPTKVVVHLSDGTSFELACSAPKPSKATGKENVHAGGRMIIGGKQVMVGFNCTTMS